MLHRRWWCCRSGAPRRRTTRTWTMRLRSRRDRRHGSWLPLALGHRVRLRRHRPGGIRHRASHGGRSPVLRRSRRSDERGSSRLWRLRHGLLPGCRLRTSLRCRTCGRFRLRWGRRLTQVVGGHFGHVFGQPLADLFVDGILARRRCGCRLGPRWHRRSRWRPLGPGSRVLFGGHAGTTTWSPAPKLPLTSTPKSSKRPTSAATR